MGTLQFGQIRVNGVFTPELFSLKATVIHFKGVTSIFIYLFLTNAQHGFLSELFQPTESKASSFTACI